ncbi:MAG: DUF1475 family protein [Phycisphaerales bacterium]|nr:DUF1475 family protein [Phycisphaerales bacterium]
MAISVTMVCLIFWAAAQANLWIDLVAIVRLPWGLVTLADLSFGLFFIALWIAHLERRVWPTAMWIVLLLVLGNLATAIYLLVRLYKCRSLTEVLTPTSRAVPGDRRRGDLTGEVNQLESR